MTARTGVNDVNEVGPSEQADGARELAGARLKPDPDAPESVDGCDPTSPTATTTMSTDARVAADLQRLRKPSLHQGNMRALHFERAMPRPARLRERQLRHYRQLTRRFFSGLECDRINRSCTTDGPGRGLSALSPEGS